MAFAQSTDTKIPWESRVQQTRFNGFLLWLGPDDTFTADATADTLTATAHGMNTLDGPFQLTNSGGALPGGLAASTNYWAIRVDDDTLQLAASFVAAKSETAVDIIGAGSGTHSFDRASYIVVPPDVNIMAFGGTATTAGAGISVKLQRDDADWDEMPSVGTSGGNASEPLQAIWVSVTHGERYSMVVNSSDASNRTLQTVGTYLSASVLDPICG